MSSLTAHARNSEGSLDCEEVKIANLQNLPQFPTMTQLAQLAVPGSPVPQKQISLFTQLQLVTLGLSILFLSGFVAHLSLQSLSHSKSAKLELRNDTGKLGCFGLWLLPSGTFDFLEFGSDFWNFGLEI